jgi:hypothetical protein
LVYGKTSCNVINGKTYFIEKKIIIKKKTQLMDIGEKEGSLCVAIL